MKIMPVTEVRPSFNARFIPDSKGILEKTITDSYYLHGISEKTAKLAEEFDKLGKDQELVILDEHVYNYRDEVHDRGLKILNKSTGKFGYFYDNSKIPFWDAVLGSLVKDKKFFETDTDRSKVLKSLLNG